MSGSQFTALISRENLDRLITPALVLIGLAAILAILGYDVSSLLAAVSPLWVTIIVFGYLGVRFVFAVERIADAIEAED